VATSLRDHIREKGQRALPEAARARLRAFQSKIAAIQGTRQGLIDYVASLLPDWDRFDYFRPYAEALEGSIGGEIRLCFAAPPQHGKSEFTLRALLWIARFFGGLRHAYVTYNDDRTKSVAKQFQRIAEEAGFTVGGTLDTVELRYGDGPISYYKFTSIGGSLTGFTINGICVIDDPIKDRKDARSPAVRQNCIEWFKSVARTRRHPGTSYVVMATRWPGGDLTDYLVKKEHWRYINLKAVAEGPADDDGRVIGDPLGRKAGESLWCRKPPEFFKEDRADIFWWSSMFQGEPRSQGLKVFAEPGTIDDATGDILGPRYYRELPSSGYRVAFGVDLAYTAKTSADWSICIEGYEHDGNLYVTDVHRKQVDAPSFLLTLIACRSKHAGATFRFYASGTEKGSAQFIQRKIGRCFKVVTASADKLVRATPTSVTWNSGRILLPDPDAIPAPWLDDFIAVVCGFTGTPGERDDDVDALAALHDQLMKRSRMFEALSGSKQ
jgi:predicted phage terminase large subunit-like protein